MKEGNCQVLRNGRIGIVVNGVVKPSRDFHVGVVNYIHSGDCGRPLLFLAGNGTTPGNIKEFAGCGLDGMVFCGVRRQVVLDFLEMTPDHPPVVLCTYAPLAEEERDLLGNGGEVVLDNEAIGVQAADFFLSHGMRNFAFCGSNIYRERIAGEIRCDAFERRIREEAGDPCTFAKCMVGVVKDNEDFWETGDGTTEKWIRNLPNPCGVFVNGDREAANIIDICHRAGIKVPDQIEVLSINNSHGFCENARPAISSIHPDVSLCAKEAMEMLIALIADPGLARERRRTMVASFKLVERGSTSNGEYGHIVALAREYIRVNACSGIEVPDVVSHVGVSRRLLEKRVREATGKSVLDMIQEVKLENVRRLLVTTTLPISDITTSSGYELTSNLSKLFRRTFGMSMRDYRVQQRAKD